MLVVKRRILIFSHFVEKISEGVFSPSRRRIQRSCCQIFLPAYSTTPAGPATRIALQARPVPHHREIPAFATGFALIAFHTGFGEAVEAAVGAASTVVAAASGDVFIA